MPVLFWGASGLLALVGFGGGFITAGGVSGISRLVMYGVIGFGLYLAGKWSGAIK